MKIWISSVLCCLVLSACSKEPPPTVLYSKLLIGSEAALKNPSALLEGITFAPADQPLNKRDLGSLSTIILQSHALALSEGERHLKIQKSWHIFRAVDLSLRHEKAWQDFLKQSQSSASVEAESLGNVISEIVR